MTCNYYKEKVWDETSRKAAAARAERVAWRVREAREAMMRAWQARKPPLWFAPPPLSFPPFGFCPMEEAYLFRNFGSTPPAPPPFSFGSTPAFSFGSTPVSPFGGGGAWGGGGEWGQRYRAAAAAPGGEAGGGARAWVFDLAAARLLLRPPLGAAAAAAAAPGEDKCIPEHVKEEMKQMAVALGKKWDCPFCMEMIENDNLEITNCGHFYCKPCLTAWKDQYKQRGETKWKCGVCNRSHNIRDE